MTGRKKPKALPDAKPKVFRKGMWMPLSAFRHLNRVRFNTLAQIQRTIEDAIARARKELEDQWQKAQAQAQGDDEDLSEFEDYLANEIATLEGMLR